MWCVKSIQSSLTGLFPQSNRLELDGSRIKATCHSQVVRTRDACRAGYVRAENNRLRAWNETISKGSQPVATCGLKSTGYDSGTKRSPRARNLLLRVGRVDGRPSTVDHPVPLSSRCATSLSPATRPERTADLIAASISGRYDFPTKFTTHVSLPVTSQSNCIKTIVAERIGHPRNRVFQKYSPRCNRS